MKIYFYTGLKTQFTCKPKTCWYFGKYRALIALRGYGIAIDYETLKHKLKQWKIL